MEPSGNSRTTPTIGVRTRDDDLLIRGIEFGVRYVVLSLLESSLAQLIAELEKVCDEMGREKVYRNNTVRDFTVKLNRAIGRHNRQAVPLSRWVVRWADSGSVWGQTVSALNDYQASLLDCRNGGGAVLASGKRASVRARLKGVNSRTGELLEALAELRETVNGFLDSKAL